LQRNYYQANQKNLKL